MGLAQRAFYTVQEAAFRWDCCTQKLAGWAAAGKLDIVTAIEPIRQNGEVLGGIVVVPISDILSSFRRWGSGATRRTIRRLRLPEREDWVMIEDPEDYIAVDLAELMIVADDVYEFEQAHGLAGRWTDPGGARARYDWEGLYAMLIPRVHCDGIPETQAEWIAQAQDWFAGRVNGDIPDERTMRRRLGPIWKSLQDAA